MNVNDDAEQYTRATYNENMGSARVHFYVDDLGAWQNLKAGTGLCSADPLGSAEVSWHSGDGSVATGGNMTSLSMEIIMNESTEHDAKAYDNGARIAAWLLWKNGLGMDKLVSHTYWVNKSAGKTFNSNHKDVAMKNWAAFKAVVKKYVDELVAANAPKEEPKPTTPATPTTPSTDTYPETLTTGYYRVRKTWKDSKSQLGAYRVLKYAKAKVDENPGYYVFTNDGKSIYPVAAEETYQIYTVQTNDTLWGIAKKFLGNGTRYTEIKALNGLKSDVIYKGLKLKIPHK